MNLFSQIESLGHEQVIICSDPSSQLKAIIAIHDTTLGPALGGTRLMPYESEDAALEDVLRLSRGMTYKAACANMDLGGGKAVIIAHPEQKTEALFRSFGRFVQSLGGRYITAEDMNTNVQDMDNVRRETRFVTGVSKGLGGGGDPSPITALGTYYGILASVHHRLGRTDLRNLKISVQGVGSVGKHLCHLLHESGAQLFVTDIDAGRLNEMRKLYNATVVPEQEFYSLDVDIYSPCARGGTINSHTLQSLKAKVVAGCANNQLEDELVHSAMLKEANILYAPDYVINAGGLIHVANELTGHHTEKVKAEVAHIGYALKQIFAEADKQNISTHLSAQRFAENRIQSIRNLKAMTTLQNSAVARMAK